MKVESVIELTTVAIVLGLLAGCSTVPVDPVQQSADVAQTTGTEPLAAEPEKDEAEDYKNTLRWSTASEVNNFGFDIYRSTSEDGPFERITTGLIPGAGTTDEPQAYVYVDDTIDPTMGYFYYIESISIDSVREKFSPVIAIGPKKPVGE